MTGLPTRTLFRIINDASAISFAIADRIVSGIEGAGGESRTSASAGT